MSSENMSFMWTIFFTATCDSILPFTKSETWLEHASAKASSLGLAHIRIGLEGHVSIFIDLHLDVHRVITSYLDHADPKIGIQNLCGHLHSPAKSSSFTSTESFLPSCSKNLRFMVKKRKEAWYTLLSLINVACLLVFFRIYLAYICHCSNLRPIEPQFIKKLLKQQKLCYRIAFKLPAMGSQFLYYGFWSNNFLLCGPWGRSWQIDIETSNCLLYNPSLYNGKKKHTCQKAKFSKSILRYFHTKIFGNLASYPNWTTTLKPLYLGLANLQNLMRL